VFAPVVSLKDWSLSLRADILLIIKPSKIIRKRLEEREEVVFFHC
jgi:hypothetical protein